MISYNYELYEAQQEYLFRRALDDGLPFSHQFLAMSAWHANQNHPSEQELCVDLC